MAIEAAFFDGLTARRRTVEVSVVGDTLVVREAGEEIARWPVKGLKRSSEGRHGPLRLRHRDRRDARLVFETPDARAAIEAALPHVAERRGLIRLAVVALSLAVVSGVTLTALYYGLPQVARPIAALVPTAYAERYGDNALDTIVSMTGWQICDEEYDGAGQLALEGLAGTFTDLRPIPYELKLHVVDAPLVNAFALPGGTVVFTDGLLQFVETPEELAAVLAHELGHVAARDPMTALVQQLGLSLLINLVFSGGGDVLAQGAMTLAATAYTREMEMAADVYALTLMQEARYDTAGFAAFFERLLENQDDQASTEAGPLGRFTRTHPYPDERAAGARAATVEDPRPVLSPAAFDAVRTMCPQPDRTGGDRVPNNRPLPPREI